MIAFKGVGVGMTFVPKRCTPYNLDRHLCQREGRRYIHRLYASVRKDGRIAFSAKVHVWASHDLTSIGHRKAIMWPVNFARLCGWILPLIPSTPLNVVCDYLIEHGQEETAMVRLLQLLAAKPHGR